jgi:hypothetical protein
MYNIFELHDFTYLEITIAFVSLSGLQYRMLDYKCKI